MLLSNKVLEDPRQRRLFKTSDLVELFNYNESIDGDSSESDQLFRESKLTPTTAKFSSSKIEKMRKLAATLSKNISESAFNSASTTQNATTSENSSTLSHSNSPDSLKNTRASKDSLMEQKAEIKSDFHERIEHAAAEIQKSTSETSAEGNKASENIESVTDKDSSNSNNINESNDEGKDSRACAADATQGDSNLQSSSSCDSRTVEVSEESGKKNNTIPCSKNGVTISQPNKTHHKHKHKRKGTQSERESAIFEGERISHLIGRRLGRSEPEQITSTEDDQYVLEKLFAKASNYLSNSIR